VIKAFAITVFLLLQLTQLYFLGFLQNWTPRGIDDGPVVAWPIAVVVNLALVALFATSHSVMARPAFKQWWIQRIPPQLERCVYVLVSIVTLSVLFAFWLPLPQLLWHVDAAWARYLIYGLFFSGALLLVWAIHMLDTLHFMGLRQAFGKTGDPTFAERGPYRFVRHPIQSALIVIVWATPQMSVGHFFFAMLITAYSLYATLVLEERDLRKHVGTAYEDYRSRVPALIPGLKSRRT
jgi:protein-S-isoprenylcysteine O-methyltransferase Ste14